MNIFALPGFQVKITEDSINNGKDADKRDVTTYLKLGEVYTVKQVHTYSRNWTVVMLNELPCLIFNADCLVDVEEQSKEDNRKHPQWAELQTEITHKLKDFVPQCPICQKSDEVKWTSERSDAKHCDRCNCTF